MPISVQFHSQVNRRQPRISKGPGGENIDKKKLFALIVPALIIVATGFAVTAVVGSAVMPVAAESSMGNITIMINDFIPTFMQIMIVMVFVLLLLVLVDRVGKHM
jgi:hypothetical protein